VEQRHQLLEGHPGGADEGHGAPEASAHQIPVAHDAQARDLRFQILAQQHALTAFCRRCDQASGLLLVVQQCEDVAHLAVQLGPVQQILFAAQKYVGLDGILQDGSRCTDNGHQLRVDLAAQLCQQPGGKIHRRYKGKVAVEQCGKCCRILAGEAGAHPCHTGTNVTGRGNGQHSRCAAAHLNHFIVGDAQILGTWGADGGGAAADGGQRLGGTCGQLFRLMVKACEHRIHTGAAHTIQRLIVGQQIIKVVTVALGAGHTARAGVGLLQQTQLCQRRHLIAKRCAGNCHVKVVCQHAAANGLAFETIQRHDRLQDSLLACIHRHSACLLFAFALFV
jgi:hypothetical protein